MKTNKKILFKLILCVLIISLPLGSTVFSAGTSSYLEVWGDALKLTYNNKEITADAQPLLISIYGSETTYIPLRAISNLFNKSVDWNAETSTVIINDKPDPTVTALRTEIATKDQTIMQLSNRIKELQDSKTSTSSSSSSSSSSITSISDLEDYLNGKFYKYKDLRFKIYLSGDKSNITLRINVDLSNYNYDWYDLTSSERRDYVQDVCDAIRKKYRKARIEGYIRDSYNNTRLLSFTTDSDGDVNTDTTLLMDIQDSVDSSYKNYFSSLPTYIRLEGNNDNVTFKINLNYDDYRSRWRELTNSQIENLMSYVYDNIYDKLSSPTIVGYFYDTSNSRSLAKYWKSGSSTRRFERYVN